MINVVHLTEDLNIGGLERVIDTIVTGLDKSRFNPKVWCLVRGGEIYDELRNNGIEVELLNMQSHRDPVFLFGLYRKLKKENIHILHSHGCTATTLGRLAAIFARTPVILSHMHTTYWEYTRKQLLMEKFLSFFTDKIICCSQAVADFAVNREKINSGKLAVIYNGVDVDKYESNSRKSIAEKKEFVIGCVASLAPHKGHKYLLEAAKNVIDDVSEEVRFVMLGKGNLRQELEEYARNLGIGHLITFREPVSDISKFLSQLDLVVLPSSEREGLGLAIIEAMAAGRPVIATSTGGLPEVIEQKRNGLLVPPKNSDALSKAISYILNDREKAGHMGIEGRAIVKEKFDVHTMLDKVEKLYQGLISEKIGDRNKCNILFTSSFSSLRGGGQRSLHLLIKYLNRDRFEPFLMVPGKDELSDEAVKLGVNVFVFPFPRIRSFNIFSSIKSLYGFRRIVKNHNIQVIHTESPRETFYATLVKMISGVPVVFHARVSDSHLWMDSILYYLVDSVIAVSQAAANRFTSMDRKGKVKIASNGVELDIFSPSDSCQNNGALRVGYFGQIERRKGIDVLIRAVNRISERVKLTVMGTGDGQYLEELKHLSNGAHVMFKDYRQDVREDISMNDVVVLPSRLEEGLSRSIIEAMAMGKVVIASDFSSNREALGEELKEFIFPVGDDETLASMLIKVSDDRNILNSMKSKARSRAESFFDIKKNTEAIEKVYESLITS